MIPTREELEERRHVGIRIIGYFHAFCEMNSSCEKCDPIIRIGCMAKVKIEDAQTKRIKRICKEGE